MKFVLVNVRVIRNTCGLLGAALMLVHCGTGSIGYRHNSGATAEGGAQAPADARAPAAPSVPGLQAGLIFDAASNTAQTHAAADTAYYTNTATTLTGFVEGAVPAGVVVVGKK